MLQCGIYSKNRRFGPILMESVMDHNAELQKLHNYSLFDLMQLRILK